MVKIIYIHLYVIPIILFQNETVKSMTEVNIHVINRVMCKGNLLNITCECHVLCLFFVPVIV